MKKEQILGLIRQILTAIGGYLIAIGIGDETIVTELIGAIMFGSQTIWGWIDKSNRNLNVWYSFTRHLLSGVGGFILHYELISVELWNNIVAIIPALFSIILSQFANRS